MIKTQAFIDYLENQDKQKEKSIQAHLANMNYFTNWAKAESLADITHISYNELLNYVQQQKEKQLKVQTIKLRLNSISKYYEYLKHIGLIEKNPTKKIRLKGELKSITQNVFSYTELEQLYNDYLQLTIPTTNSKLTPYAKQRNNVLLGLMLWQGAGSGEIAKIQVEDVNLNNGTIYIPKVRRGASRELKLYPNQIIQLYQYINETRAKLKPKQNELIAGYINDQCTVLFHQLKGLNQKVKNASQLRTSIIIHWIKVYGKRQAQYMAGHKYISSTERFELQELDSLTDSLLKHHPFS